MPLHTCWVLTFLMLAPAAGLQPEQEPELAVAGSVDLERYSGTWYEIARLPNPFQSHCAGDVTATYALLENGDLRVVNRCRTAEGELAEAEGRARRASHEEPNSKLKVRFAPALLSFLPFVWGDYWILELAPDYSHVVIGEPGREYLWILARSPTLDEDVLMSILGRVREQGYDTTGLLRTSHTSSPE